MATPIYRRQTRTAEPPLLIRTIPAIARRLGVSEKTVWNWIHKQALPVCKLPSGLWGTTDALLERWILARHTLMLEQRRRQREEEGKDSYRTRT